MNRANLHPHSPTVGPYTGACVAELFDIEISKRRPECQESYTVWTYPKFRPASTVGGRSPARTIVLSAAYAVRPMPPVPLPPILRILRRAVS